MRASVLILISFILASCMKAERVGTDSSSPEGFILGGISLGLIDLAGSPSGYTGAQLVAVGGDGGWYSMDGKSWGSFSLPGTGVNARSVAFGRNIWVAVGNINGTGCGIWTSPDGQTWAQKACPLNTAPVAVAYGNSVFVVGGPCESASIKILRSTDNGSTWIAHSPYTVGCGNEINSLSFDTQFNRFIGVSNAGIIYQSTDGSGAWSTPSSPILQGLAGTVRIYPGPSGKILILGEDFYDYSAVWTYGMDGTLSETSRLSNTTTDLFRGIAFGAGNYVAVGTDSSTYNCYHRTAPSVTDMPSVNLSSIFASCGTAGFDPQKIVYHSGIFAVGGYSFEGAVNEFVWSLDGKTWTQATTPATARPAVNAIAAAQ